MITPNGTIILTGARLSFPHLLKPTKPKNKINDPTVEAKFDATAIIPEADPQWAEFNSYVDQIMEDKWPGSVATLKGVLAKNQRCWGFGRESLDAKTNAVRIGYDDASEPIGPKVYIHGKNRLRPFIMNPATGVPYPEDNEMVITTAAAKLYAGCFVSIELKVYCWDNTNGRGVSGEVVAVMFEKDGPALGAGRTMATGFTPVAGAPAPTGAVPGATPGANPFD